ncbi:galactose-specific lectin nattectin-like [Gigantopelta aegis]|uniref:galactose-specific lectin nattectin-like n=1 Tax=Gigantopelta aegis TaxID=1735272 RepID=UPI001B88BBC0|nr:galactose-specific lectin nattectin-like [Gigantopelta aegis]
MTAMDWLFVGSIFTLSLGAVSSCPLYWIPHEESCYVIPQVAQSWASSVAFCMAHGAHLAEITSPEENNFLSNLVKQNHPPGSQIWIGGTDALSEGNWIWSHTEEIFQYQNWDSGQPSNYGGSEHCVTIRTNGKWNDNPCCENLHSICEKRRMTGPGVGK